MRRDVARGVRLVIALALVPVASCRRGGGAAAPLTKEPAARTETAPPAKPDDNDEHRGHEELPRIVKLSAAVIRDAKIATAPARAGRLAATVELSGQVAADPDRIAMIGARVTGRVLRVAVREGDRVRAGQIIATISSPELAKRRADHAAATARAASARRNAERLRGLFEQRLGSEQDAVAASAEASAAEAERDSHAQALRGMGAPLSATGDPSVLTIVTPLAGQVVARDAVPGQPVEPGHTIATVADLDGAFFQAQLFEKDLGRVREGATAEVRLNGYPDRVLAAKVARIASQVDPQSRTLTARLAFTAPSALVRLGLYGVARISAGEPTGGEQLLVPLSAVTDIGDRKVVFVRHADGDFEVHEIRVGSTAGGSAAVLSGIDPGEEVVVSGVHTLKSSVLKSALSDED